MNKLGRIFLIVLIYLIFISCDSNPIYDQTIENNDNSDSLSITELKKNILGNWEWEYTILMSRNLPPPDNKITPFSEGFTMSRFFDSETVTYFKNNSILDKYNYTIEKFKLLPNDKTSYNVITIENYKKRLLFIHPDTLMIGDGWTDGINEFYVRKK